MKPLLAILACGLFAAGLRAAPITRDLGQGLFYFRIAAVPADLPAANVATRRGCVLDVRFARADSGGVELLNAWLQQRATPRTPVLVLANAATAAEILAALAPHEPAAGILVIGSAAPGFAPDLDVRVSPADERRAYDALAEGVSLSVLLTDNPDKVRNDEASLSRDRLADASAEAAAETTKPAPPPVDVVLQRAVHVHRALVALKKL